MHRESMLLSIPGSGGLREGVVWSETSCSLWDSCVHWRTPDVCSLNASSALHRFTVTINDALIYFLILLRGGGELCPSLLKNHWQMFNFTVLVRGRAGTQTQLPSPQWVIRISSIIVCYWESEMSDYMFLESMTWASDWAMMPLRKPGSFLPLDSKRHLVPVP